MRSADFSGVSASCMQEKKRDSVSDTHELMPRAKLQERLWCELAFRLKRIWDVAGVYLGKSCVVYSFVHQQPKKKKTTTQSYQFWLQNPFKNDSVGRKVHVRGKRVTPPARNGGILKASLSLV